MVSPLELALNLCAIIAHLIHRRWVVFYSEGKAGVTYSPRVPVKPKDSLAFGVFYFSLLFVCFVKLHKKMGITHRKAIEERRHSSWLVLSPSPSRHTTLNGDFKGWGLLFCSNIKAANYLDLS